MLWQIAVEKSCSNFLAYLNDSFDLIREDEDLLLIGCNKFLKPFNLLWVLGYDDNFLFYLIVLGISSSQEIFTNCDLDWTLI